MSGGFRSGQLGRRAALLLPLGLAGCTFLDDLLTTNKPKTPGDRQPVMAAARGLEVDNPAGRHIALPRPVANPAWPQAGGDVSHVMGHVAAADTVAEAWTADIGAGGGYR